MSTEPSHSPAGAPHALSAEERDRVRGCLIAAACADGIGAPFEGAAAVGADAVAAWEQKGPDEVLRYTDDTALMLALADHLAETARPPEWEIDQDGLARAFAWTWEAEPGRGYGAGAARVLHSIRDGTPWREAAGGLFGGTGSYGNGGAMRVAPIGLLPLPLNRIGDLARRSAAPTHAHEQAREGAAIQACAVACARRSGRGEPFDAGRFLTAAASCATGPEFRARLARLHTLVRAGCTPEEAACGLGNGVAAVESVPAALAAFLHAPDDVAATVRFAVRMGGDTDTVAAMAAAMTGARVGAAAIPEGWTARLERRDRIERTAAALARALH